jgi:hypothetical protein
MTLANGFYSKSSAFRSQNACASSSLSNPWNTEDQDSSQDRRSNFVLPGREGRGFGGKEVVKEFCSKAAAFDTERRLPLCARNR